MAFDKSELSDAVRRFWNARSAQAERQGRATGRRDTGARSAVTGGGQMDGFAALLRKLMVDRGVPTASILSRTTVELPGWFRAEKKWDLLVIINKRLIAAVELKSQVGPSFGNNFNNRTEEALGSATDLWAAYREGAFEPSARPWLGYLMMLEDCGASQKPVKVFEPHFKVFKEFRRASYATRYEQLLLKLVRDRLYDGVCFLTSESTSGLSGRFREPNREMAFARFAESLIGRVVGAMAAGDA